MLASKDLRGEVSDPTAGSIQCITQSECICELS
jgi:hypothetical protein